MIALACIVAVGPANVVWEAPQGCPGVEYVEARIDAHLQGTVVEEAAGQARAKVTAPGDDGQWRLTLEIADEGAREIGAGSCEALADAAALMIAISLNAAVDPEDDGSGVVPEPTPPEQTGVEVQADTDASQNQIPTITEPVTAQPVVADPAPPREPAWRRFGPPRAVLGIGVGVHGVGLPVLGAGLGGRVGVRWGPLRAALFGAHWFRRERPVVDGVVADYRLSAGGLELCGVLPLGRVPAAFELMACAELELGLLRGAAPRAQPATTQRHLWLAPGAGVAALWTPRRWIGLGLRADVMVPTRRRAFVVGDVGAGTVGVVDARGAVVVEFLLPPR